MYEEEKYTTVYLKNKKVVARMIRQAKEELKGYHIDVTQYIFHVGKICEVRRDVIDTKNAVTAFVECKCRDNSNMIVIDRVFYNEKTGEILQSGISFG
jgi:hypothetical protein